MNFNDGDIRVRVELFCSLFQFIRNLHDLYFVGQISAERFAISPIASKLDPILTKSLIKSKFLWLEM